MQKILRPRAAVAALLGTVALTLAACTADLAPTAPSTPEITAPSEPSNLLGILDGDYGDGLVEDLLANLSLYSCDSPDFGSVSKSIGPAGGVIRVGPHSLTVPAGALSSLVTITATARAGKYVKVDFQPHGLRFERRAVLRLSYAHCARRPLLPTIVYVEGSDDLLSMRELLPALNDLSNDRVTTALRHFSGYAIAD
jgi:hypothetical protein